MFLLRHAFETLVLFFSVFGELPAGPYWGHTVGRGSRGWGRGTYRKWTGGYSV